MDKRVIVDRKLKRATDFETHLGEGRVQVHEGNPRYCPLALASVPHGGHEFEYAYLGHDGTTWYGSYWCWG